MFDVDEFLEQCVQAESHSAIKEVVERAVAPGSGIADALPPSLAGIQPLHVSPELTVLKVVWAPGMTLYPHDHRMWATIGIYTGGEDNAFFRRAGSTITSSGGKELRPSDVCMLGDNTIHSVHNPTAQFAGAIHVYGGDFFAQPRSEWVPEKYEEQPFSVDRALQQFEDANAQFSAER